jgi:DNA-binding CsgD family transcriptional regulator
MSSRFRVVLRPLGFHDELRAVFRSSGNPWGALTLWRRSGQPPFSNQETDLVAGLSAPIGEALRRRAVPDDHVGALVDVGSPGLLTFDLAGNLISADDTARARLADLSVEHGLPTDLDVEIPVWLVVMVFHAAAAAHGVGDGTARARVRLPGGRWLACHASCLQGADGSFGAVVVVIEPASPAAIAPIVVEAYDLSEREREVTRLVARGLGTADIAAELYLSAHTVRDHLKSIFQKVEVSSRGELVAKVFADHYEPVHLAHGHTTDPD